jgi:hypothetical protein
VGGACSTIGERRGVYRDLLGKPEGKRPLGIPRRLWEDNIIVDLQEMGWGHGLDCSSSGQGQVAVSCKRCNQPSGSIK